MDVYRVWWTTSKKWRLSSWGEPREEEKVAWEYSVAGYLKGQLQWYQSNINGTGQPRTNPSPSSSQHTGLTKCLLYETLHSLCFVVLSIWGAVLLFCSHVCCIWCGRVLCCGRATRWRNSCIMYFLFMRKVRGRWTVTSCPYVFRRLLLRHRSGTAIEGSIKVMTRVCYLCTGGSSILPVAAAYDLSFRRYWKSY